MLYDTAIALPPMFAYDECEYELGSQMDESRFYFIKTTPSKKCFAKCYFTKLDIMNVTGHMNLETYRYYLQNDNINKNEQRCVLENDQHDLCERAFSFGKCMQKIRVIPL